MVERDLLASVGNDVVHCEAGTSLRMAYPAGIIQINITRTEYIWEDNVRML